MCKLRYLALLTVLSTSLATSPLTVRAEEVSDVGLETIKTEDSQETVDETPKDEEVPDKVPTDEPKDEEISDNPSEDDSSDSELSKTDKKEETDVSSGSSSGVVSSGDSSKDTSTTKDNIEVVDKDAEKVYEIKKEKLTSIPADININIPSRLSLEWQDNWTYGLNQPVTVSVDENSDSEYEVIIALKSTKVIYVDSSDNEKYIDGCITLGDGDSYTWESDDLVRGSSVPLVIEVTPPESGGYYKTSFSLDITVYEIVKEEIEKEPQSSEETQTDEGMKDEDVADIDDKDLDDKGVTDTDLVDDETSNEDETSNTDLVDDETSDEPTETATGSALTFTEAKEALELVIIKAEDFDSSLYTESSYKLLTDAIVEAKELLESNDTTVEQLEKAKEVIKEAIKNLELIEVEMSDSVNIEDSGVVSQPEDSDNTDNFESEIETDSNDTTSELITETEIISQPEVVEETEIIENTEDSGVVDTLETSGQ